MTTIPAPAGGRFFDTSPLQSLHQRWRTGDPPGAEELQKRLTLLSTPGTTFSPPYRWLVQPVDVAMFGLMHFMTGLLLGWVIDRHVFGRLTPQEILDLRQPGWRLHAWMRVLSQVLLLLLVFNYGRKILMLIKPKYGMRSYSHDPVPAMDGGFAMSIGLVWTQRNLIQRVSLLLQLDF